MLSTSEALQRLNQLRSRTDQEVHTLRLDAEEFSGARKSLTPQVEAARMELAAKYLPELTAEALERAARLTGFRGFQRMDPLKAMARERAQLELEISRIEAHPRYQQREALVGPNGEITARLHQAELALAPWEQKCRQFESLPGFLELLELKYDTPEFTLRWWDPAYWKAWAQGDAICSALGKGDFGDDVLPAYEQVREPRDRLKAEVERIAAERDAVLSLVQKHDRDLVRRDRLPELYLQECRQALAQHLASADLPLLAEWAGEDSAIQAGLRKLAGLAAKGAALEEVVGVLREKSSVLGQRSAGYSRKLGKLQRPKHAYGEWDENVAPMKGFAAVDKSAQTRSALRGAVERILGYDDYEHFSLTNPSELWWYEFTRSRPPRGMALRSWYDSHPDPRITYVDLEPEDVDISPELLQATASRAHDPLGDLS